MALDDIAMSKGIEFEELLDEIEAIVYSGTKLNIDYFLEDIMDEDHLLDIYDYFKESTTDKIDDALDELGDDFTEEEVRLVRIKFISEMANWLVLVDKKEKNVACKYTEWNKNRMFDLCAENQVFKSYMSLFSYLYALSRTPQR